MLIEIPRRFRCVPIKFRRRPLSFYDSNDIVAHVIIKYNWINSYLSNFEVERWRKHTCYLQYHGAVADVEFMSEIDAYIRWYNGRRIKLTLDGMSPVEYRKSLGLMAA